MSKNNLTPAVAFHEAQPPAPTATSHLQAYEVLKGLSYFDNKARGEVGDIVTDLPEESIAWLLEQGCIKPVDEVN